jgi:hypothetical protein
MTTFRTHHAVGAAGDIRALGWDPTRQTNTSRRFITNRAPVAIAFVGSQILAASRTAGTPWANMKRAVTALRRWLAQAFMRSLSTICGPAIDQRYDGDLSSKPM